MPRAKAAAKKSASKKATNKKNSGKAPSGRIKVEVDKDSSIGVSRIENGYIISESGTTGTGKNQKWYNKQFYSPVNPLKIATSGKIKFGGKK